MRGDGVFMDQRNIDLAVAAVNELPALLTELDTLERRAEAATKALREVIAADTAAENGDEAADRRWDEALAAARSLSSQEGQK
jgi:hypothetical protein